MGYPDEVRQCHAGTAGVQVFHSRAALGVAAAQKTAELIVSAIGKKGRARIMVTTGNCQSEVIGALVGEERIPYPAAEVFLDAESASLPPSSLGAAEALA